MRKELTAITSQTNKPYNVNFFCHSQPEVDAEQDLQWLRALSPYYAELNIDPSSVVSGAGRVPFDAHAADLLEEFRPPVVSFHFGLPAAPLLDRVRACGAKVISSATTVEE